MTVGARNPEKQIAKLYVQGAWIVCKTPFNRDFVEALKEGIDRSCRKWDGVEKVWKVDVDEMDNLEVICKLYFKEVIFIEVDQPQAVSSGGGCYADLICDLPDDALKRVFRLVALSMHPDQGGTDTGMSKVNDAWHAIQKQRGMLK
jgi:hypothetical protein